MTFGETSFDRPVAILISSVVGTAVTLPVDHIKTRL